MTIIVDGIDVHYEVRGSGPYLFLLHGWGAHLGLFDHLAEVLSTHFLVVSVDFPGCGQTQEPAQSWGMDEYLRFTESFIASFSPQEIILLGHSHGGRVAIGLAARDDLPFTMSKLILVDSAGIIPHRSWKYHLRVRTYKMGKALLGLKPVKAMFPGALDAFQGKLGSTDYSAASPVMRESLVKVVNTDMEPLLPQIKAETLLIWGENDQDTPVDNGRVMEKAIPGSGLVVLPGAGHYSFIDNQYGFTKVMESFLNIDRGQ
ncbi:MAG: alpha/beta hydrolase [Propionibacteriaceae bacterium]|nr:alpha/beta hydrolase [Propionibacteriaceae bacterium]